MRAYIISSVQQSGLLGDPLGACRDYRQVSGGEPSSAGTLACLLLYGIGLRGWFGPQGPIPAAQFICRNGSTRQPGKLRRKTLFRSGADVAFDCFGDMARRPGRQKRRRRRAFPKRQALLDCRDYRFRACRLHHVQAEPAEDRVSHLCQLRASATAGHGQMPPLRQPLARPGTNSADVESA